MLIGWFGGKIVVDNHLDIVFLGGLFPKDMENEIYKKSEGPVQVAANNLQWNLVKGLDKCNKKPVKIINSLFIGSYPKLYKDLMIKTYEFEHTQKSLDINVGFLNIFLIKNILKYWTLKPYLKKWAQGIKDNKVIIAYSLNYTFVKCLKYIKKVNPKITTCIIVPDLPEYMNLSNNVSYLYRFLKYFEIRNIKKNSIYINSYVLLTEQMAKFLNLDTKYTVVEGISSDEFNKIKVDKEDDKLKTVLYTGTLNEKYGVLDLVEAFSKIKDKNYRLIICGLGDSVDKIKKIADLDHRIIFKGQIKRDEILKLQISATVLVNPRKNNEEFTKYSFPSKILEYLSSGTPVIAYKLDGMPNEYNDYIFYLEDNNLETLTEKIIKVCSTDTKDLNDFGLKAKKFVNNNKNKMVQCEKILRMIKGILNE